MRVRKVRKERRVIKVKKEKKELTVTTEQREKRVKKDKRETKDRKVKKDFQEEVLQLQFLTQHQVVHQLVTCGGICLLYTSPSPRDKTVSRMPSSA